MSDSRSTAAGNAAIELVTEIWLCVLGVSAVGLDDDFFYLGGDSLTGLEVIEQVYSQSGVDIPPMAIYDRVNTIRNMAEWIETEKAK